MFPPRKKKRQTRRSISLKGLTYQRLKAFCDANGHSVSGFLEQVIGEKMDEAGQPIEVVLKVHYPREREDSAEIVSQYFTF